MDAVQDLSTENNNSEGSMNCVATRSIYPYKPLGRDLGEIRLLVVAAAADATEHLRCSLIHVFLNQEPQYQALSYTWGHDSPCRTLVLDGFFVPVRENLERALKRLRQAADGQPLVIWVDAICIDQDDNAEKSDQISQMRSIFEKASMVAVWIGSETANSHLAFKLVRDLTECHRDHLSALITDPSRSKQIEALRELYYRDYWWRIWIVQEVVVARNATVYCGQESIPWSVLDRIGATLKLVKKELSRLMYHDPDSVFKLLSSGTQSMKLPNLSATSRAPLLKLLRPHKSKYSSDPRDKIYAIVGISAARDDFTIDYSWSPHRVYVYAAQYIIKESNNLDVICVKNHDRNEFNLPSWVPDWRRDDDHTEHRVIGLHIRGSEFKAGGEAFEKVEFHEDGLVLAVEGFMIGTVKKIGMVVDLNQVLPQAAVNESLAKLLTACEAFRNWWSMFCAVRGDDVVEQDVFERTLFGGSWSPEYEIHQQHRLQLFSSLSKTLLPDSSETAAGFPSKTKFAALAETIDNEKNQKAMVHAASLRMHGKRLVIADTKHVGLAPWNSIEGDILCVLLGCSFPVILRPVGGYYVLIGETYVDELMSNDTINQLRAEVANFKTLKLR